MTGLAKLIARYLPMLLVTLLLAGPLVWMLGTSLKSSAEYRAHPEQIWPFRPLGEVPMHWENYRDALSVLPFWQGLANTLMLCLGSVLGTLFSCSLAAYAFARLRWPGRDWVFAILISTMLLPWQATMIPRFLLIREVGLYNSLGAIILPTFFGDAFYIFLLRQFFRTIPEELSDAARIDGCSEWGVFWRVILPLSWPALATISLFQFIAAWNDYGGPLLYLSDPKKFPLAYGLEQFVSSHSSQTELLMAAAVLFTLPLLLLFFLTQKTFIRGIATTGLKA